MSVVEMTVLREIYESPPLTDLLNNSRASWQKHQRVYSHVRYMADSVFRDL